MDDEEITIGFLSSQNYFDRLAFSGILFNMYRSLSRRARVIPLGRPHQPSRWRGAVRRLQSRMKSAIDGGKEQARWNEFCRVVDDQLSHQKVDLIFAPVASLELSQVEPRVPVVYASDTTFRIYHATYELDLTCEKAKSAEAAERHAIESSSGITYPSAWAADSAVRDYGATPERICIIPYGANLDDVSQAAETTEKCGKLPWEITFIGMDWKRKGGDVALKAFEMLQQNGLESRLTIIGSTPPRMPPIPGVNVIPFLDKRQPRDRRKLKQILLSSHFLLFPTVADCSPIVLCEAAAYGIPVVAPNVGGISTIVTESNGRLLPNHSSAEVYAMAILDLARDPIHYRELVRSSRRRYETVLNWDNWSDSLVRFCRTIL